MREILGALSIGLAMTMMLVAAPVVAPLLLPGADLGPSEAGHPGRGLAGHAAPPGLPLPARPEAPEASAAAVTAMFGAPVTLPGSSQTGEPSIATGPNGELYVVAPTNSTNVWRSLDGGASFQQVAWSLGSSGDSDVAVDANGILYVSDLFDNVPVSVSSDQGDSFQSVVPTAAGGSIDRQWLAARGNGLVWSAWRDGSTERVAVSTDGGQTYTRKVAATGVGWQGNLLATSDTDLWIPYTSGSTVKLAKSTDGGLTWSSTNVKTNAQGFYIFPAVAVDTAKNVYVAWSDGFDILLAISRNGGASFAAPIPVSTGNHYAVFPWLLADAPGHVAVTWYEGDPLQGDVTTPLAFTDPELDGTAEWFVKFAISADADTLAPSFAQTRATEAIHNGSICASGTLCVFQLGLAPSQVPMNRALLDFFEMSELPDGRVAIAYTADAFFKRLLVGGNTVNLPAPSPESISTHVRVVVQTGGTNLKS
jgi:hypothetical protein